MLTLGPSVIDQSFSPEVLLLIRPDKSERENKNGGGGWVFTGCNFNSVRFRLVTGQTYFWKIPILLSSKMECEYGFFSAGRNKSHSFY
jgi:hypothetical protein